MSIFNKFEDYDIIDWFIFLNMIFWFVVILMCYLVLNNKGNFMLYFRNITTINIYERIECK